MENALLTIRQMTNKFKVTARTLRFYEYKELLSPVREGQKRLYTNADQSRLKLILRAKSYGFSLDDIYEMLSLSADIGENPDVQFKLVDMAQRQLSDLKSQKTALDASIKGLEDEIAIGVQSLSECSALNKAA